MGFQWENDKSVANEAKHGISFLQAAQIFRGPVLKAEDNRRDYGERRFIATGSYDNTIVNVIFTERDGDIRIISAWRASKRDRKTYQDIG